MTTLLTGVFSSLYDEEDVKGYTKELYTLKTIRGSWSGEKNRRQKNSVEDLVEQLRNQEQDIFSKDFSNQDIFKTLYLSLGTVKWHTSNIYGSLIITERTKQWSEPENLGSSFKWVWCQ